MSGSTSANTKPRTAHSQQRTNERPPLALGCLTSLSTLRHTTDYDQIKRSIAAATTDDRV